MTDDLKNFEKAPEADTPQTEDPTTLEMPTDDLEADIEPGKPDDDFERMLAQAGALSSAKVPEGFRCGYVAVVGRPNVGKSTLINAIVGEKVSITSKKPQTTRNRVLGVLTTDKAQFIFVDTPGFQTKVKNQLTRRMNRSVRSTLSEVDAVVMVIESNGWKPGDLEVLRLLPTEASNVILAVSKTDLSKDRNALLPLMADSMRRYPFAAIVPVSAEKHRQLDDLLREISFSPKAFRTLIRTSIRTSRRAFWLRKRSAKRPSGCSATNCPTARLSRLTSGRKRRTTKACAARILWLRSSSTAKAISQS